MVLKKLLVLFTHYHGDHYGLFRKIEKNTPMYIGSLAKNILKELMPYIDLGKAEKAYPLVEGMRTYVPGKWMNPSPSIEVKPLYVDHSALDAYMFYIKMAGKKILFTGDFRDHGIVGQNDRFWRTLKSYVPQNGIDLLFTEGTMLSRIDETDGKCGLLFPIGCGIISPVHTDKFRIWRNKHG